MDIYIMYFHLKRSYDMDIIGTNFGRVQGLSAYEVWLSEGNIGTQDDFLDSLKGVPGAQGIPGPQTGTLTDILIAGGTQDIATAQIRNIRASTTDLTAGTSSLPTGQLYLVYE